MAALMERTRWTLESIHDITDDRGRNIYAMLESGGNGMEMRIEDPEIAHRLEIGEVVYVELRRPVADEEDTP